MGQTPPPEVEPVSLTQLALVALGTFLVLFFLLEAFDPRWIAPFRGPATAPTSTAAAPSPIALRPLPRPPATNGSVESGEPVGGTEGPQTEQARSGAGSKLAVVAPAGDGAALRAEPGSAGQILARMQAGAGVELTGQEREVEGGRWVEIRTGDWIGWLEAEFLTPAEAPP